MVDYIKQPTPGPVEMSQRAREDHATLPEHIRFENALAIWVRDMRAEQLALVKKGGRLSVAALAYEEVLKLRGILGRFMRDRHYRIQGRWNRRLSRRLIRDIKTAKDYLDEHDERHLEKLCWCGNTECSLEAHK